MKIKKYLCGLLIIASTVTSAGTGIAKPLVQGGRLVIYSQEEPKSLDPLFYNTEAAKSVYNLIYSGLVKTDDNFDYYPDLAVSVPTIANRGVVRNDEGMVVTYKLKDLTFWHDGLPVTSEDVRFTWQAYTNPDIEKAPGEELNGYKKIYKIETPDPKTVKIYFKEFYPDYNNLFNYILPKHGFVPKRLLSINASHPFNYRPIGSGPFMFVEWKPGSRLVLDANPKYYKPRPHLDQIIYTYGKFSKDITMGLEKGKIHMVQLNNSDEPEEAATAVKNTENYNVTDLDMEEMAFNLESPVLKDYNVRNALAHAINRDKVAENFNNLQSTWSDTHPNSPIYDPGLKEIYNYDLNKSQYLLDNAGWKVDENDGIRKNSQNQELALKLVTTDSKVHRATASYLQEVMSYLGIKFDVKVVKEDDWDSSVRFPDTYDLALYNRKISINGYDRIDSLSTKSLPPYGHNYSRYNNSDAEAIFSNLRNVNNISEQKKISALIKKDLPVMPLFSYIKNITVSTKLNNFRPNLVNGNTWNSTDWWLN
jgi:peptide/nickel transport system substrate-binding protein